MNPVASWLVAFLLTSVTAITMLVANRRPSVDFVAPRDPASLSEADSEIILNRIREGDLVAIQGNLAGARKCWQEARERGTGYWPVHEALGDSLVRHGCDAEAAVEYETAGRLATRLVGREPAGLLVKKAGVMVRLKQPEAALTFLIECGQPDRLAGGMAQILKEHPPLLEVVRRAADTRDARLWALVALMAPDTGDRASALGKYWKFAATPDAELARRAICDLQAAGRSEEALHLCETWSKSAPSNPEVYETWGRLLSKAGQRDRARLVLSTIVDMKAGDASAHARLGSALRELGDFEPALRQFEEVSRLRPEEPAGLQEIVITHLTQGRLDAAVEAYERLTSKKWESRFGDVGAALRSRAAAPAQLAISAARTAGDSATVDKIRRWCAKLGVAEMGLYDVKVILKWDAMSDVDLDVTEPGGETLNHQKSYSKTGGTYLFDNTQGRGPEHYVLAKAPTGKYRVGVHLHGSTASVAEIEVILFEETPRERRLTARVTLNGTTMALWPVEFDVP